MSRQFTIVMVSAVLCFAVSCRHKTAQVIGAATPLQADNSYTDLAAGGRLRIVVPLLKSGGYRAVTGAEEQSGNTIVLSAGNLIGYEVSYYSIETRGKGRVRLSFRSAELTKDGKTTPAESEPSLPFALPLKSEHIRLIYYIRNSQSDHNMAIAASRDQDGLNAFTERLKLDPSVCRTDKAVFCSWVPAGIAVRPE